MRERILYVGLCLFGKRCVSMVRKGWTHVEVLDGWTQVLRGPRPKAEKWPHLFVRNSSAALMPAKPQFRGRWRHGVSQPQAHRSTSSPICIGSVGSRGQSGNRSGTEAKDQVQAATQAKREPVPEAMFEAARVRVSKLEAAIKAMGEFQGPEVQFLRGALARASVAAPPPLVDTQQFIDRAMKRIEGLDSRFVWRRGRLHRLQQEVAAWVSVVPEFAIPGNDSGAEVQF